MRPTGEREVSVVVRCLIPAPGRYRQRRSIPARVFGLAPLTLTVGSGHYAPVAAPDRRKEE